LEKLDSGKWWSNYPFNTRCKNALRRLDQVKNEDFKNESVEDFKKILESGRMRHFREVGAGTENAFKKVLGMAE